VSSGRRFSQAIAEGDGISLIAQVDSGDAAARAEVDGADAVLVLAAVADVTDAVRNATSLPLLANWPGNPPADLAGVDACVLALSSEHEWLERQNADLSGRLEIAWWVEHEDELAEALERFDPEIFILAALGSGDEEALDQVLDLLADVPAGKLAIAEVAVSGRDDVGALERGGFDGVIVDPRQVAELAGDEPPDV
jgi:hypothetical protein